MDERWTWILLAVFATHLPFFAWRAWRTRELRYAATTLTFALLVASFALRIAGPELRIADLVALHRALRWAAWCAALVSLTLLIRHHLRARRPGVAQR